MLPKITRTSPQPVNPLPNGGLPARPNDVVAAALLGADRVESSRNSASERLGFVQRVVQEHLDEAFGRKRAAGEDEAVEDAARYASGATADSVASTIFRGVTERLFGALERAQPDLAETDFDAFVADVRRGVETGVGEARGVLAAKEALSAETEGAIDETVVSLGERLDAWFLETRARLFESA